MICKISILINEWITQLHNYLMIYLLLALSNLLGSAASSNSFIPVGNYLLSCTLKWYYRLMRLSQGMFCWHFINWLHFTATLIHCLFARVPMIWFDLIIIFLFFFGYQQTLLMNLFFLFVLNTAAISWSSRPIFWCHLLIRDSLLCCLLYQRDLH